jgi:hypothetical protein
VLHATHEQFSCLAQLSHTGVPTTVKALTFSSNRRRQVWPTTHHGSHYCHAQHKLQRQGRSALLDELVEQLLARRPGAGRLFLQNTAPDRWQVFMGSRAASIPLAVIHLCHT